MFLSLERYFHVNEIIQISQRLSNLPDHCHRCFDLSVSSGASAPEKLVQSLLNNIKKNRKVSIEEVTVAEEKVVFKLPRELN